MFPAGASAHATLTFVSPATQSRLDKPPTAVVMRFDQTVTITSRAIEVFTAGGHKVSGPAVSTAGGRGVRAALSGLHKGEAYTVRWRATSADGHTGSGVYTFGIGVTPPPPTEAFGSTGPGWADDAARWAFFVSLALLLGTIGFRLLILREPLQERLSNRLYGIADGRRDRGAQRRHRGVRDAGRPTRCRCRSSTCSTATSRRSRRRRASGSRSSR